MKTKLIVIQTVLLLIAFQAHSQGTLVYDQQSASGYVPANVMLEIEFNQPIGQSFVPTLSSIGFVQLELGDSIGANGVGATIYVNLLADSIIGPILSSTSPVFMPDNFFGITSFFFSTPIAITPGTTYFFQPVVESGDKWRVNTLAGPTYPTGTAFFNGAADSFSDLWFREGVVVPEPSPAWLLLLGGGVIVYVRRRHISNRAPH